MTKSLWFKSLVEASNYLKANNVLWNQEWAWEQVLKHSDDGLICFLFDANLIITPNIEFSVYFKKQCLN